MSHASSTCDLKVHHKMVADKNPDAVIQKCKYRYHYQRHYMIFSSCRAEIPVCIITSNYSSLEFFDPKDGGSKLLQNESSPTLPSEPPTAHCNVLFHLPHNYLNKGFHALATTVHTIRIQD